MKVFWEKLGILGSVYQLVGQGLSDCDIAERLSTPEVKVQSCVSWLLHFLVLNNREDLVLRAFNAPKSREVTTFAA
jgi:DNA-binding NarL/FixJ family response regulator